MMTSANAVRAVFTPDSKAVSAFDYLLAHAKAAGFVWVPRAKGAVLSVELQWADRRLNPFSAQAHADYINFYLRRPILKKHEGLFDAATRKFGKVKPNRLGEYRKHLESTQDVDAMLSFLRKQGAWPREYRVPAEYAGAPGAIRYPATNQNLIDHALEPAMRWLIAVALDGATMTYGQVKRRLETEAGFSTIFATRIGLVAGELMNKIQEVEPSAPLINVLVVNQEDGLPSKGAGSFMAIRFRNPRLEAVMDL